MPKNKKNEFLEEDQSQVLDGENIESPEDEAKTTKEAKSRDDAKKKKDSSYKKIYESCYSRQGKVKIIAFKAEKGDTAVGFGENIRSEKTITIYSDDPVVLENHDVRRANISAKKITYGILCINY